MSEVDPPQSPSATPTEPPKEVAVPAAWGSSKQAPAFGAAAAPPADPVLQQITSLLPGGGGTSDPTVQQITALLQDGAAAPAATAPAAAPVATPPAEPTTPPAETPPAEVSVPAAWGGKKQTTSGWGGVQEDKSLRVVHPPLKEGIGTGKAFFFLFGFKITSEIDQGMLGREMEQIDDDVEVLRNAGYTVIVDPHASREDFTATLYSEGDGEGVAGLIPAGFYWSAHGHSDGGIECCDGSLVHPTDVDTSKVSPGLRLAIFGACYVGSRSVTWKKALGGKALIVGWGRPVTIERAVDFLQPDDATNTDLDDLIRRWLLTDDPLPDDSWEQEGVPESPVKHGRIGELTGRIGTIAEMLGGRWREFENRMQIEVPLANQRTQVVDVFLTDASEPFCEGEVLFGAESNVGELTALTDVTALLSSIGHAGFGRIALVKSETEMPRIVAQAFTPLTRSTDQLLAAQVYQVASKADALENQIFGVDQS
jgi:hypothetical protein